MKWLLLIPLFPQVLFGVIQRNLPYMATPTCLVHNRPLAKVNQKVISVMDVKKQLDLNFDRFYPDHRDSQLYRFEYYTDNWSATLQEIIDTELILADASTKEITISPSEVREEMEKRFGPNIMSTLDRLGLHYEEARLLVQNEMIVRQMQWFKLHSKALQIVTPQVIKNAYRDFCEAHPAKEEYVYQTLTIKGQDLKKCELLAEKAAALLKEKSLQDSYEELSLLDEETQVILSSPYTFEKQALSSSYREILSALEVGAFSSPIHQVNRVNQEKTFKIFKLISINVTKPPPFEEIAEELRNNLFQSASEKEYALYLEKLRSRYNFDKRNFEELIAQGFKPFEVR